MPKTSHNYYLYLDFDGSIFVFITLWLNPFLEQISNEYNSNWNLTSDNFPD